MAEAIHIQLHADGAWQDAARFEVTDAQKGPSGSCWLEYDFDWAFECMQSGTAGGVRGLGSRFPPRTVGWSLARWPALLDDIRPSGAAERWWVNRLGLDSPVLGLRRTEEKLAAWGLL